MTPNPRKGLVLMWLSVICNGAGYHLMRAALGASSPELVVVLNCFWATAFLLLLGVICRLSGIRLAGIEASHPSAVLHCLRHGGPRVLLVPGLAAVAGWVMNTVMRRHGAEVTAFLGNQKLIFLIAAGLLSGERLKRLEVASIALIVGGAFLFSYQGGRFQVAAVGLMAFACALTTVKQMVVKRLAATYGLPTAMICTVFMAGIWAIALAALRDKLEVPSLAAVGFSAAGALCGSTLGMLLLYSGYLHAGVARAAPLDAMRPMAVLLFGLLLGAPLPGLLRIVGGTLILLGSILIVRLHRLPVTA